jgi:hypothetical protein
MSTKQRVNGPKRRGQTVKAQSDAGLAEVARATNSGASTTSVTTRPNTWSSEHDARSAWSRPAPVGARPAPGLPRSRAAGSRIRSQRGAGERFLSLGHVMAVDGGFLTR